jgi:MFS family permease
MALYDGGSVPSQGSNRAATRLILLLSVSVLINYVDRGNLATAAPLIQDELKLSATQLGMLFSAFYWTYVSAMVPAGWLAERYGAHRVLAGGLVIWSVATLLTGFAAGFASLLLLRLMLGLGESAAFPCGSKLFASQLPTSRIGMANGIYAFGYLVGPAIGTVIGGLMMTRVGWRPVFILFGVLSLVWLWPWMRLKVHEPKMVPNAQGVIEGPRFAQILKERGLWGASLGHFAANYNYYFIISWLPLYLVKYRGFSLAAMAGIAGVAYLINAVCSLLMGWVTDRWIRAGRSPTVIYKAAMAFSHVTALGCMAGLVLLPVSGAIACLFLYEVGSGVSSPGVFAISQIMAGPQAAGRWVGVQNLVGNLAGILAPAITGRLIDVSGSFESAFALASLVNILGVLGWVFILPKVAPIVWQQARGLSAQTTSPI